MGRDRSAYRMQPAAEVDWEHEHEHAAPAPVQHGSPYARQPVDQHRSAQHFVQEPVRGSLDQLQQQQHQHQQHQHQHEHQQELDDQQLGSGGSMPVSPTHAAEEFELLPRRMVSQRPGDTGSRYDSLQSVDPGTFSWAEKPGQVGLTLPEAAFLPVTAA